MKLHRLFIVSAILAAGFLCSCSREQLDIYGDGQYLMLSPALFDIQEANTKAISNDELKDNQYNENKVSRLDVFVFKKDDGSFIKDYHISGLTPSMIVQRGGKEGYLLSSDWQKDGLLKDVGYYVFVIANSTNETITTPVATGSTITENQLKALSTTDADIYKLYKQGASSDDVTYSPDKTFLMNARVDSWTISDMGTQLIIQDESTASKITLERAAVKFVMDVSLSDKFLERLEDEGAQYGNPSWKYVNFNTATAEVYEGTTPEAQLVTRGSGAYLTAVPGATGHFVVTTYAYPQSWTAATSADKAPAILLSYTVTKDGTSSYHYYYIPLCANTVTSTQRNKLYKVNAVISSYGSFETLTNDQLQLTYEVMDWTSASANVNAYATDYLVATPTRHTFNGGSEGEYLSKTFHYYASSEVEVIEVEASYKNQNGEKVVVEDGYTVSEPANGTITVTSTVPTNGTYRTLEFTVRIVGTNKTQKVIVRHTPADCIMGITSSWCSYDDPTWTQLGTAGTYYASGESSSGQFRFYSSDPSDHAYSARVAYNGGSYYMNLNGTRSNTAALQTANNQMYVLEITSANDTYSIGKPTLSYATGTIYNSNGNQLKTKQYATSTDNVLSPAFMLGSQICSMKDDFSNVTNAALHCALYKEVDTDGNEYTGWRLPTKQEIQYMIENQIANPNAMALVVRGRYYWTLDGDKIEFPQYSQYGGGNGNWVRCVRDVTPEEIARINQF